MPRGIGSLGIWHPNKSNQTMHPSADRGGAGGVASKRLTFHAAVVRPAQRLSGLNSARQRTTCPLGTQATGLLFRTSRQTKKSQERPVSESRHFRFRDAN